MNTIWTFNFNIDLRKSENFFENDVQGIAQIFLDAIASLEWGYEREGERIIKPNNSLNDQAYKA